MISHSDLFRVSIRQVIRQRSYGVIFSIALGIMAFITLAVLGREIRYTIGQDMVLMGGVNIVQVILNDNIQVGDPRQEFFPATIDAIRKLPGVAKVSANLNSSEQFFVRKGDETIKSRFYGVDENYWYTYAVSAVAGRLLNAEDINERRRVCVIGWQLADAIYGSPQAALGKMITVHNDLFEVVGVVGGIMIGGLVDCGFMPYTTMVDRKWAGGMVDRIHVRASGWEDVESITKKLPSLVAQHQDTSNMLIRKRDEQLERIQNTFVFVEALLWLGIATSLMLGGFGIWYGTFAAVRARTREVGLKKAMGGSDRDILMQFLTEALCKSVAGGSLGIVLGILAVEIGSFVLGSNASYSLLALSSAGSIAFSAFIGVGGGLLPAIQASRMDVVTALRFE